jgi:hypothetical protein
MNEIFCYPTLSNEDHAAFLAEQIATFTTEYFRDFQIGAEQSVNIAESAVVARARILSAVYGGDYHTDSFDIERLARQVRAGMERIWFWGEPEELRRLRSASAHAASEREIVAGTVSMLDASGEFGPGHIELCRSGSLTAVRATPFSLLRVLQFVRGEMSGPELPHTLVLVPRARAASPPIRGGEAVNKLHRERIRSRFFGFAPWYVMQGGILEVLEFREVHRDRRMVLDALEGNGPLFFSSASDMEYAQALLAMNYRADFARCEIANGVNSTAGSYTPLTNCPESLRSYNHMTFAVDNAGTADSLDTVMRTNADVACLVVRIDLHNESHASAQRELNRAGFRLTCLSPSKRSPGSSRSETWGFWSRPSGRHRLAPPFYFDATPSTHWSEVVLGRLHTLCQTLNSDY